MVLRLRERTCVKPFEVPSGGVPSPSLGVFLPTAWSNNNAFNKPQTSAAVLVLAVLAIAYPRLVDGEPRELAIHTTRH